MTEKKWPHKEAIRITRILDTLPDDIRYPVNVEQVALELTPQFNDDPITRVQSERFKGVEGALLPNPADGGWGILYNSGITHPGRLRFTLAHELGHYMVHRHLVGLDGFECTTRDTMDYDPNYAPLEMEANVFAGDLLMPAHDFRRQIDGERFSFDLLGHCADRYGVSLTAAVLRWLDLTLQMAIAIHSEEGGMYWAKSSPKAFKAGKYFATRRGYIEVPTNSAAAEQIFSMQARDGVRHRPGVWFDDAEVIEHTIYSEEYGKTLTVLTLDHFGGYDRPDEEPEEDAFDRFTRLS